MNSLDPNTLWIALPLAILIGLIPTWWMISKSVTAAYRRKHSRVEQLRWQCRFDEAEELEHLGFFETLGRFQ